jgi:hypothetical protein
MHMFLTVGFTLGRVIAAFSAAFLVPMGWAWFEDAEHLMHVWAACFGLTATSGALLWWATRRFKRELSARDGFLLVNLVWLVLPAYSALPLWLTVPDITVTKAYFEAMSALTATGATALAGLDALPVSVNVWRCFLQLIGGLGIMLLVVAVLPLLGLGGMQLYKAETPGPMKEDKFTPRIAETARGPVDGLLCFWRCLHAGLPLGWHELGRCLHAHVHHHGLGRFFVARRELWPLELAHAGGHCRGVHGVGRHQLHALLHGAASADLAAIGARP